MTFAFDLFKKAFQITYQAKKKRNTALLDGKVPLFTARTAKYSSISLWKFVTWAYLKEVEIKSKNNKLIFRLQCPLNASL